MCQQSHNDLLIHHVRKGGQQMQDTSSVMAGQCTAVASFFGMARARSDTSFVRHEGLVPEPQLFSVRQLQEHLNNPLLTADWCQVNLGGKVLDLTEHAMWKTVQQRKLVFIDKTKLNEAIAKGASVVLEGLDILDVRINAFLAQLDAQMPCALSNCEAFFSQRGNEAYGGHRDSDDVLVIQIAGEKRWNVHEPQQRRFFGNSPLTREEMGPVAADFVMKPGDVMFMKAGVPHRVFTEAPFSLHLSIDLIDRTPNIEQITHLANDFYNRASADPHLPPSQVVQHYQQHLQSQAFAQALESYTRQLREQAATFRGRVGKASAVQALSKFF
jgi:ribosomal protein L16 Arg81 hydroxylase